MPNLAKVNQWCTLPYFTFIGAPCRPNHTGWANKVIPLVQCNICTSGITFLAHPVDIVYQNTILMGESPKFHSIFKFSILCWRHLVAQRQRQMRENYKPFNIQRHPPVSDLKQRNGDMASRDFTIQNRDGRTNVQKTSNCSPHPRGVRSPSPIILVMVI